MAERKDARRRRTGRNRLELNVPKRHDEAKPGWSDGIRALYDGVVQEPLPPDLLRLLQELGDTPD